MAQLHLAGLATLAVFQLSCQAAARLLTTPDTMVETGTNYYGNGFNTTIQPSLEACSQLCRNSFNNSCNIFVFCGNHQGCLGGFETFPFGTCSLKQQVRVWPVNGLEPEVYDIDRNDGRIPWTSGAPFFKDPPEPLEGWNTIRGADLFGHFDYDCPFTSPARLPNLVQCQYVGSIQVLASLCEQDPTCRAFVFTSNTSTLSQDSPWFPNNEMPTGVFKGGEGFDVNLAYAAGNPSTVVYWKPGLHDPNISHDPGALAGVIVGSLAGAVLAAAVTAAAFLLLRRRARARWLMQGTQTFPATSKPSDTSQRPFLSGSSTETKFSGEMPPSPAIGGSTAVQLSSSIAHSRRSHESSALQDSSRSVQIAPESIAICRTIAGAEWKARDDSFGQAYKATLNGSRFVTVRRLQPPVDGRQQRALLQEISTLSVLPSTHLVKCLGLCQQSAETMLVSEWMEESLWDALTHDDRESLRHLGWYSRGRGIALGVAKALQDLHACKMSHLHLTSRCILMQDDTAKIADAGIGKILSLGAHSQQAAGVSWAWAAPELLLGKPATMQADIYSLGVILWELVTGGMPVRGSRREVQAPSECPEDIKALIAECTRADPAQRVTASKVVQRLEALEANLSRTSPKLAAAV